MYMYMYMMQRVLACNVLLLQAVVTYLIIKIIAVTTRRPQSPVQ